MAQAVGKVVGGGTRLVKATQDSLIPKLQTFWRYARVELRPPAPGDWPQIQKGFANLIQATKNQKWKTLTVKEATLNTLVAAEIACWFFIGECIGKRALTGYQIDGAVDFEAHI